MYFTFNTNYDFIGTCNICDEPNLNLTDSPECIPVNSASIAMKEALFIAVSNFGYTFQKLLSVTSFIVNFNYLYALYS